MRIGIDLMGGDTPAEHLFPAILEAAIQLASDCTLVVIATKPVVDSLSSLAARRGMCFGATLEYHTAQDVISMDDDPLEAIRRKKDASLVVGIHLLKNGLLDAFVSCGNTGALIAGATLFLPLLPGVERPALLVSLPTKKGPVAVLDVGGNLSCKAQDLVQFAFQGASYQRTMHGVKIPRVGLLNVGVESKKGTPELRQTFEQLQAYTLDAVARGETPKLKFEGNVEGRDIFDGVVDVLVTDGFSGNILLKTAEGVARFIFDELKVETTVHSGKAFDEYTALKKQFNYSEYPGAIVCGVDRVLVKVHGNAKSETLLISIHGAVEALRRCKG